MGIGVCSFKCYIQGSARENRGYVAQNELSLLPNSIVKSIEFSIIENSIQNNVNKIFRD